jgi:hypothetical protein
MSISNIDNFFIKYKHQITHLVILLLSALFFASICTQSPSEKAYRKDIVDMAVLLAKSSEDLAGDISIASNACEITDNLNERRHCAELLFEKLKTPVGMYIAVSKMNPTEVPLGDVYSEAKCQSVVSPFLSEFNNQVKKDRQLLIEQASVVSSAYHNSLITKFLMNDPGVEIASKLEANFAITGNLLNKICTAEKG